jgi:competence CoiA-like predicted nuclease
MAFDSSNLCLIRIFFFWNFCKAGAGNEHKTPSISIYDRNFHLLHWGREAFIKIRDGEIKPGENHTIMEKFKLDLPSSVAQKGAIHQTENTTKEAHLNMRATIDYFREIYDHSVSTVQKNIGFIRESKIEKEDIRFVITVPAQWNDAQRAIMHTVFDAEIRIALLNFLKKKVFLKRRTF